MKATILVASHKPAEMPQDSLYLPVQVNAGLNPLIPGFQPDNEGNNISALNYRYCELTALWWGWKNLDADNLGLNHYRRFSCTPNMKKGQSIKDVLKQSEAETLLTKSGNILPRVRSYYIQTLAQHFLSYSFANSDDIELFGDAIKSVSPAYLDSFERVMKRTSGHMCNMFILRRDYLDDYCPWLFSVMNYLDMNLPEERTRMLGYYAEHMLDIWIEHNGLPYLEIGQVFLDRDNEIRKRIGYAFRLLGFKEISDTVVWRAK